MKVSFIYEVDDEIYCIGHGKIFKVSRIRIPYDNYFKKYKKFIQEYQKGENNNSSKEYENHLDTVTAYIYNLINYSCDIVTSEKAEYKINNMIPVDPINLGEEIKNKLHKSMDIFSEIFNYLRIYEKYPDVKDF